MTQLLKDNTMQPQVAQLLLNALEAGRATQSYLFSGPAGSGKKDMAYAFAQALLCVSGGCGTCDSCLKVESQKHPDVHFYTPMGVSGYLSEQIREVIADADRAPIQAKKKVYVLDAVERMNAASANAFLKTLEEPRDDTVIILLTTSEESVLPTIVSRCQVIRFTGISAEILEQNLAQTHHIPTSLAHIAAGTCMGSIDLAHDFCSFAELQELRAHLLSCLNGLAHLDDWEILQQSQTLAQGGDSVLENLQEQQAEELERVTDFLTAGALKQLQANQKRQLTARTRELFSFRLLVMRSWLSDLLHARSGSSIALINTDAADTIKTIAQHVTERSLLRACDAVDRAQRAIDYNVGLQLCLDTLLLELREILYDSNYAG